MMRKVYIAGVGMHPFGKYIEKHLKELGAHAFLEALADSGLSPRQIEVAYIGNSLAGFLTGQEAVRGQTIMREIGLQEIPIINVENACASSSTAFYGAWMSVASGLFDCALALGVEKLYVDDTPRTLHALAADSDVELEGSMGFMFAGNYAMKIKRHMYKYGTTREQIAKVVVKSHDNSQHNPYAQYRNPLTVEEVLNSKMICDPLTLFMTAPIGDGAAAAILVSEGLAKKLPKAPILVAATVLKSGFVPNPEDEDAPDTAERTAKVAYEVAGLGPEDIDVAEVHDAMATAEIMAYESLGFCAKGGGGRMVDEGRTEIGGDIPVNPSGGLIARGHPVGATGLGQISEIVWQLRGEAGKRQVEGAKVGLIQNGGGNIGGEPAAMAVHIFTR